MKYHHGVCILAGLAAVTLPHSSQAQANALNATGNVGIGTTSPATALHVVGPFTPGWMQVAVRSNGADDRSGISFINNAGNRSGVLYFGADDLIMGKDSAGRIRFFSAGTERFSIDQSGNVGIGWPNPNARLDVQGLGNPALRLYDGSTASSTIDFQRSADGWKLGQVKMTHAGNYGSNLSIKLHPNDGILASAPIDVLTVLSNGSVGVGTTNPVATLHVRSSVPAFVAPLLKIEKNIGTNDFSASQHGWQLELSKQSDGKSLALGVLDNGVGVIQAKEAGVGYQNLSLQPVTGNVGIGTTNPTQKLSVNGTIRAKEVIVETSGWSDYVFADNYALQPLSEVEEHIKEHKHLSGIPSAQQVAENGIGLGEMQAKLLAKIEELTLYVIDVKKDSNALKAENAALKARIAALEAK